MIQACASRVKLHLMVIWQRPKCRFNFPFETCTKTSLHFELIHSKDNTSKYKVQVTTKRNDSRVNNHQRFQLQGWRANKQLICQFTTDYHTQTDHIYTNIPNHVLTASVLESYYSDKPIFVCLV